MKLMRGDIVWLDPSLSINLGDNVQNIDRPWVILSNNRNNKLCPIVNIACLTKQDSKANYPMHVLINKNKYRLDHNSVICIEQLLTVNADKVVEKIVSLDAEDISRIDKAIYIQLIDERKVGYNR